MSKPLDFFQAMNYFGNVLQRIEIEVPGTEEKLVIWYKPFKVVDIIAFSLAKGDIGKIKQILVKYLCNTNGEPLITEKDYLELPENMLGSIMKAIAESKNKLRESGK